MNDYAPLLERAFDLSLEERSYQVDDITGTIPEFLHGTYYLNGPARFERAGLRYRSWLDGDGMVCALRFEDGRVWLTNRYVRNTKFVTEEEAGRPVFRQFGTAFEADRLRRGIATESPTNISVYPFAGVLLAFGEYSVPWALDPVTLETRGPFTFNGRLNEISPFSPHPKVDPLTGELFNFGVSFSATRPQLHLYRFNAQAEMLYRQRVPLDYPCSVHDCSLSPRYLIFHLSPYLLNIEMLMRKGLATIDGMTWEPERGSTLRILSRETGSDLAAIPIGQRYCLHLTNSFEVENRLVVDVIEYDRPLFDQYQVLPNLFTDVSAGRPVRFVVDVNTWKVEERQEVAYTLSPDFPSCDRRKAGQPYQDAWMLGISASRREGRKFFDQLVHVDWSSATVQDIYQLPSAHYLGGEPVFVGDPRSEAGVVICHIFDAAQVRSAFALFDAARVADGPVATLRLRSPMHLGFHATFDAGNRG